MAAKSSPSSSGRKEKPRILWQPKNKEGTNMWRFMKHVEKKRGLSLNVSDSIIPSLCSFSSTFLGPRGGKEV